MTRQLREIWSSPYFVAASGLCTIIGFVLAIYFYRASIRVREVVYCVPPSRTIVVDPSENSGLRVQYRGHDVTSKVTGLPVVLWNSGRDAVRPEHVLEAVRILTVPRRPILEARVRRQSRDVCGVSIDMHGADKGEVVVNWRILEAGDGAEIQLLYAGGTDVTSAVIGTIEGQRSIKAVTYTALKPGKNGPWWAWILPAPFILWFCVWSYRDIIANSKYRPHDLTDRILISLLVLSVLVLIGYLSYAFWQSWPQMWAPKQPFDF